MLQRTLTAKLRDVAERYPVISLTGPRQSGKTTLVRETFPRHEYVSLELPDERALAVRDPRAFLGQFKTRVIKRGATSASPPTSPAALGR